MMFIEYSKCSTCIRAKKFLDNNNIKYIDRAIKEDTPSVEELTNWINKFNLNINKLFNTSGLVYRELNLKDKLKTMNDNDKIKLLASNGMLIKRPILVDNNIFLIGFKENEWKEKLL